MDSPTPPQGPLLTLEPLLEAVSAGLEDSGWQLSGLQKTTSYEFEGRWAGDSTRSAYLFFHKPEIPDWVSIDAFLDETSRGLKGNLALVLDGPALGELRDPERALAALAEVARRNLPEGYRAPITLRYRLPHLTEDPARADTEIRFKLILPRVAISAGSSGVAALAVAATRAFQEILDSSELRLLRPGSEGRTER
jgi:hypothetical protein